MAEVLRMTGEKRDATRKAWIDCNDDIQKHMLWSDYQNLDNSEKILRWKYEFLKTIVDGAKTGKLYAMECLWSDVNPFEVVEIKSEKTFVVRAMNAELTEKAKENLQKSFVPGGFFGHTDNDQQEWIITPNVTAGTFEIRYHNSKREIGFYRSHIYYRLANEPYKKYDYNF